jgi:hypothetical protein
MGPTLSVVCAYYSIFWMTFIFILLLFPSYQDPNAQEMNYAVVVLGFVLVFCLVFYYFPKYGGKTFFTGPVNTLEQAIDEHPEWEGQIREKVKEEQDRKRMDSTSQDRAEVEA